MEVQRVGHFLHGQVPRERHLVGHASVRSEVIRLSSVLETTWVLVAFSQSHLPRHYLLNVHEGSRIRLLLETVILVWIYQLILFSDDGGGVLSSTRRIPEEVTVILRTKWLLTAI